MERMQITVRDHNVRSHRVTGFTLIELMIVVVIVAILAGVAYPSYISQRQKSNRAAAQSYLLSLAAKQEQVMLDRRGYVAATGANSHTTLDASPINLTVPNEVSRHYNITVALVAGPPPGYTISATPIAGSSQASDGTLTLNAAGVKTRDVGGTDKGW